VCALQVAAAKEKRVFPFVQSRAGAATNPVAQLIAKDGAKHSGYEQPVDGNYLLAGKYTCRDEQGIAWKKETNKETSFDKEDARNDGAECRRSNPLNELFEAF